MKERKLAVLISFFIFTIIQVSAVKKSYIVYLGSHLYGIDATTEDLERAKNSHYKLLGSYVGSEQKARDAIIYSYTNSINGFAATIEEKDAEKLAKHPDVVSVFENKIYKLHTTRSWSFLEMESTALDTRVFNSEQDDVGKNVIIATLDGGVWPESKSFKDEGMGPIPLKWRGYCGDNAKGAVPCNRKLIGAKFFNKGLLELIPGLDLEDNSRDLDGHGSHTLSTAAGRFVPGANSFGYANGTARGGAPGAHVAAYKVCWSEGCSLADVLAGFDAAIYDNVDIISVSLGGGPAMDTRTSLLDSTITLGSLHAAAKGIQVVCSAGNNGPYKETVTNIAPWVITVGASTIDRDFPSYVLLGNKVQIKGASTATASLPQNQLYPLIYGSDAAAPAFVNTPLPEHCNTSSLDPAKVKGKIVICMFPTDVPRTVAEITVKDAGGAGMILMGIRDYGNFLYADPYMLPATMITFDDGLALRSYMSSTKNPMGNIAPTVTRMGVQPAPSMADFSSRGPCYSVPEILKPDITAPGVDILAAFTEYESPTEFDGDTRRTQFYFLSGTSMSCPHVSGLAGHLKSAHPDWSFSAIKSAIMTTATTKDNMNTPIRDHDGTQATPFAYGNGHIRPINAFDPGLVYDNTIEDYLNFLCTLGYNATYLQSFTSSPFVCPSMPIKVEDLNYPSIAVGALDRKIVISRRLKNVGPPGTYSVQVEAPPQVDVAVRPQVLTFSSVGEEKNFSIAIMSRMKAENKKEYKFGRLAWSDGVHQVASSIAVNVVA